MRYVLQRLPYASKNPLRQHRRADEIGHVDPLIVGRPSVVPCLGEYDLAMAIEN